MARRSPRRHHPRATRHTQSTRVLRPQERPNGHHPAPHPRQAHHRPGDDARDSGSPRHPGIVRRAVLPLLRRSLRQHARILARELHSSLRQPSRSSRRIHRRFGRKDVPREPLSPTLGRTCRPVPGEPSRLRHQGQTERIRHPLHPSRSPASEPLRQPSVRSYKPRSRPQCRSPPPGRTGEKRNSRTRRHRSTVRRRTVPCRSVDA